MSFLLHTLIVVSYAVVAAVIGYLLPTAVLAVPPVSAPLIGAIAFLLGVVAHVAFVGSEHRRALARGIGEARLGQRQLQEDFDQLRAEMKVLRKSANTGDGRDERVSQVVAEVKILQGLIEQFHRQRSKPAPAAAMAMAGAVAAAVPGAAAPAAPVPDAAVPGALVPGAPVRLPEGAAAGPAAAAVPADGGDESDSVVLEIVREALRLDRVDVYLQPIVSLPQRKRRFYECFTRIRADDGSVVLPDQYIPLAEREGLVTTIDNMLLFRCVQLIRRTQRRNRDTIFFCNISQESLADLDFFNDFVDFIADNQDLAPGLVFEVGRPACRPPKGPCSTICAASSSSASASRLDQVTHFAMDLDALSRAHFRYIKADAGRLLEHLALEQGDADIRHIKRELDRYGIDLIVEKVETEQQLVELLDFGLDFGQGYLFGEPRLSKDG